MRPVSPLTGPASATQAAPISGWPRSCQKGADDLFQPGLIRIAEPAHGAFVHGSTMGQRDARVGAADIGDEGSRGGQGSGNSHGLPC